MIDTVSNEQIQVLSMDAIEVLSHCGFNKSPTTLTLEDRFTLVHSITMYYTILQSKAELDQLLNGLQTLAVADAMKSHPNSLEPLLTASSHPTELTPGIGGIEKSIVHVVCGSVFVFLFLIVSIKSMFQNRVRYSENSSYRKKEEMATYIFFGDYLEDCKSK